MPPEAGRSASGEHVLAPWKLPKVIYVGTTVLIFTWINWIKLPFYCVDRGLLTFLAGRI